MFLNKQQRGYCYFAKTQAPPNISYMLSDLNIG